MRTAIIYYSENQGNAKKLVDAIKAVDNDLVLVDAATTSKFDLDLYERVGFASDIHHGKFNETLLQFMENNLPRRKPVFFLYTYNKEKPNHTSTIEQIARVIGSPVIGKYGCLGGSGGGLFGGAVKGHPDKQDIDGAVSFYKDLQ